MSLATSTTRVRLIAAAAILALAAIIPARLISVHAASAYASPPKPTIVLVHGAWADSSSWDQVAENLQTKGYTVDVPPNALRGLPYDALYIADFLASVKGPIVLVGHSYGGMVITNAATGNPHVKALVYVDAFIPDKRDTLLQLVSSKPGSMLAGDPTKVFNFAPYPGAPTGDVDAYVKPSLFRKAFANDLPRSEARVLSATQRPLAISAIQDPSGVPAWKSIPSWAVVGTVDHVIPPAAQVAMAKHAGSHITKIKAGHLAMISQPTAVTAVILTAVKSTS